MVLISDSVWWLSMGLVMFGFFNPFHHYYLELGTSFFYFNDRSNTNNNATIVAELQVNSFRVDPETAICRCTIVAA